MDDLVRRAERARQPSVHFVSGRWYRHCVRDAVKGYRRSFEALAHAVRIVSGRANKSIWGPPVRLGFLEATTIVRSVRTNANVELDAGSRTFASGLLPDLIAALRRSRKGDLVAVISSDP